MKYISIAFLLLSKLIVSSSVLAQTTIINDDFSDGDYINNPTWTDSESKHIVNASNMLQLDAAEETSEAVITTPSDAAYGEWEALIELGFNPSGSNLSRFYIVSDSEDLKGDLNGYFVQIGDTEDEVSLYRQDGNTTTKIIDGTDDLVNSNPVTVRIKVTRNLDGNWELFTDATGGTSFTSQGTIADETYTTSNYIGLFSDYTSTRHDLFEYDDIKVTRIIPPLDLQTVSIEDNQSFDVTFNQDIDKASIQNTDFTIDNGIGNPNNTSVSGQTVNLSYDTPLNGGKYTLNISDEIQSESGNSLSEPKTNKFSVFDSFEEGDIVINEFMFDPPPGNFNFDDEYVEIKNTTDKIFNLQNWLLGNDSALEEITADTLILEANKYMVIAADSAALKQVFGNQNYIEPSDFPGLVNSGDAVRLQTSGGTLVDSLTYTSDWGGTDIALERRSDSTPSIYQENWENSPNPDGGTPGMENEITEDNTPPHFSDLTIGSTKILQVAFDERLAEAGSYEITNNSIASINQTAADTVEVSLASDLQNAENYELSISDAEDIFGNTIAPTDTLFTFYQPSPVDSGDVAINEFMYAPPANSSEYIELYNHSDKSLDLQEWTLSDNRENFEGTISGSQFIIPPDSFVVIAPDNTIKSEYPNIALVTMGDFPALNNGGDQIIIRDSNDTLLDSLEYTSDWDGEEVALERRTVDVSGTYQSNWGNAPNEFGTPGSTNEIEADQIPPDLASLTITNSSSIEIEFDESILQQSLENVDNYQFSQSIDINQATAISDYSVSLSLANDLQNATDYKLTIDGIQDIYGNSITNRDTSFTHYEISEADTGDVFLSEFMAVPPSGTTEYIELRNRTSKSFDLQGWTINDNTGNLETITNQQVVLPPDSVIVIAPDRTLENDYPDIALIAMGSAFPSLNNSGDDIVIRTADGGRIDSLQYRGDWDIDEVALERKSFELSAIYKSNWGDSPNGFGTPGTTNEINMDTKPPTLENLVINNNQKILLIFSEYLDKTTAENTENFIISDKTVTDAQFSAPDSILLTLDGSLQNATNYNLLIENVADLFDNTIAQTDTTFTYYEPSPVDSGDVAINEFMYDPPSGDTEYIELYNHSDKSLDMQGWTLSDNREDFEATISSNQFIVPPDSFVVITPDNTIESAYPDIALVTMGDFPALNNGGDQIIIRDQKDVLLDSLAYTSEWSGDGVALERRTVNVSGTYQSNWGDAPSEFGTPGSTNEIEPDQTPPDLARLTITNSSSIQIDFDEPILRQSLENVNNYQFSQSMDINQAIANSNRSVTLGLANDLQNAKNYHLTIDGIQDIYRNTLTNRDTTFTYYEISDADSGDVFLSEFMAVPPSGTTEYVELRNTTNKSFDLQGWTINDNTGNLETITNQQAVLPPDSAIVIAPDQTLENDYPNIALIAMGSAFPSLNNSGDNIVIRTADGIRIDSLQYRGDWGSDEVALERRSFDLSAIYQSNWGSAPNGFGTPGISNEIDVDTEPPTLENLVINSNQEILLKFSEYLDKTTAENTDSYIISDNTVTNAQFSAPDNILLTLDKSLQNANGYNLSIENVADLFDNPITPTDTTFTYYEVSPVDSGDVAINEFMYAPPANSSEYIELYNHSDKSLDLQNWTLSDNRESFKGTITENQFVIPPDSFAVIAPDNTIIKEDFSGIALVAMSDFPALNNGGDQIIIRDQNGTLLDSLEYSSDWGGDEVALERRTVDVSGAYQSNWGDTPDDFGTPGSVNQIEPDNKAPVLESFAIEGNAELSLTFSEQIDRNTVENIDNYLLSNSDGIADARLEESDKALLGLENPLQNAEHYTLSVENISDIFGNSIVPIDTSFTFYETISADSGDVFINEFSFVPPTGSTEYVELYNPTDKSFDLKGWTLSDNRGIKSTITAEQFIIPPDSFIVIAPDNTIESEYPDIALVGMGSFPALNNGSDQIIVRNQDGTLLDSLEYSSDWGGDEVALERRSVEVSATFSENWMDSPTDFGTPGSQNQVPADDTPPSFETVTAIDNNKLRLTFSEQITAESATNKQHYQLSPSLDIQLISVQNQTVTLFLEQQLVDGENYEVTTSSISDIFGNTMSEATREFEYLRIDDAQSGQIVINEILYDPGTEGKADFIELYNTTDKNFDLTNWVIGDFSTEATIDKTIHLEAGAYLVLTGNQNFASNIPNAVAVSDFPSLNNNTPDDIYIRNQNEVTIDSLRYYQSWGGNSGGTSLERKDPRAASNDASNWQTNNAENGISAGSQNVTFQEDTSPPEIIFSKVLADNTFEVRFNEFIQLTDDVTFYDREQPLTISAFDSTNANVIFLQSAAEKKLSSTDSTILRAENLSDVKGNTSQSSEVSVAQPMQNGDLVINEIMFNPLADSDDNLPDQSEYIELRNTQDYAVSLEGLFLHDEPDENGNIRDIQPVSTTAKWVPPQGHVLVHADEATNFPESQVATFFKLQNPNLQSILRADRSSLSLASSDDAIYIADSTGTTIDSVFYDENWHNPNIIDTRGIALERISPEGPSNDDSNWGSSVNEEGGTPDSKNSIYQEDGEIDEKTGISFTPNPFSPDDDGYEDNLFINYKLDQQDYLIKVRIYDRYGRLVRTLSDGKQAGFEGQLIWDGRKDDDSRNRIGIYIVVFEAYDSASDSDRTFKKTVVLARQLN